MPRDHRHHHHSFHARNPIQPPAPLVSPPRQLSPPIHPLETALLAVVALHLVFLPWALGTMHVWSQSVSLGLAALGLILSLRPRYFSAECTDGHPYLLRPLPKLLRFPIFWMGLGLMLYILIQALNPAWVYRTNRFAWWLESLNPIDWLPSGMRTPFAEASPWRSLMIFTSGWMTVCSIWIGFTRRRCLHRLLIVLVANGVVFALVGLAQKLSGAKDMLWFLPAPADYFFATIIYKNHAAAYLNLMLMAACGLALWHRDRASKQMALSDPSFVVLLGAFLILVADLFTNSRMGIVLGVTGLLLGLALYVAMVLRQRHLIGSPLPILLTGVFVIGFLAVGLSLVNWTGLSQRFSSLFSDEKTISVTHRVDARDATWAMFMDNPVTGWGAGSFRYYFPVYQQRFPEILNEAPVRIGKSVVIRRMSWQYAHNDYVQCLAELGAAGSAFIVAMLGWLLAAFAGKRHWAHPVASAVIIAAGLTAAHCWVDFQLHNPAILITLGALLAIALCWATMEDRRALGG